MTPAKPETIWLRTDNHRIGCELECIAQVLFYRGYERESKQLDEVAARIK